MLFMRIFGMLRIFSISRLKAEAIMWADFL